MQKRVIWCLIFVFSFSLAANAQEQKTADNPDQLTIEKIMRDPKWIGSQPSRIYWSDDSQWLYFMWNPDNAEEDSLYRVSRNGDNSEKVPLTQQKKLPARYGEINRNHTQKVYEKNGDIFLLDIAKKQIFQITNTVDSESDPQFTHDEKGVTFIRDNNLFLWQMEDGDLRQLTDFREGNKKEEKKSTNEQEAWLEQQQLELIKVLKQRKEKEEEEKEFREKLKPDRPKEIYIQKKRVSNIELSPDRNFVTFLLSKSPSDAKRTVVPNYVTDSGYTEDIRARTKVGSAQRTFEFGIYNIAQDTVYYAITDSIPGISDQPDYLQEYQEPDRNVESEKEDKKSKARRTIIHGPYWSDDGQRAFVVVLSLDNKDRWLMTLDIRTGQLTNLDRQHDEAWIGGPGIRGWWGGGSVGWLPDNRHIWFQSEESGYSHLYLLDVVSGEKKQLTQGKYEIFDPQISRDKKYWYFTSSQVHPGERHFYRMALYGGEAVQITKMVGNNDCILSPDNKKLAIRFSSSNCPWQLFIMDNKPGAEPKQITHSLSEEFLSYPWRQPQIVTLPARDGKEVYARLYRPEQPHANGAAVVFVHGAGYLQNAHKWWSSYFREYMFHNLLVDHGYTVLDIDYRGSAGYGMDWRTAIYRHMGGKDLSDQVDGARYLVEKYNIDPKRIGIYGGSYGGFITLMAMFTEPDIFACGAALRPVTDWAHYNHGYTSNILNIPYADSLAYVRSSPIYFAEGLQGALLICHGVIDTNVHFQDVMRLAQRLIELGKDNWQVAMYPLEGHGFREPSSWTDEYKRIFKLFEENLK